MLWRCPKYLLILPGLCLAVLLGAQQSVPAEWIDLVRRTAEWQDAPAWELSGTGLLDRRHSFRIYLASDGETVRGVYGFAGSSDWYTVSGVQHDSSLLLTERLGDTLESATLRVHKDHGVFRGTWQNKSGSASWPIAFTGDENKDLLRPARPSFVVFQSVDAVFNGMWMLYTDGISLATGFYIDTDGQWRQVRQRIIRPDGDWELLLLDETLLDYKAVRIRLDENRAEWIDIEDPAPIHLTPVKQVLSLDVARDHDFHYFSRGILWPEKAGKAARRFDIIQDSLSRSWFSAGSKPVSGYQRAEQNLVGIFYPSYVSDRAVSGMYTLSFYDHEQSARFETFGWTYDLKSKKVVELEDGVRDKAAWQQDLDSFVQARVTGLRSDPHTAVYWNHVRPADFRYLLFAGNQLLVAKPFDPLLGPLYLQVPPELVEQHFGKSSWLRKAIKKHKRWQKSWKQVN